VDNELFDYLAQPQNKSPKQPFKISKSTAASDPNQTLVAKQAIGIFVLVGLRPSGV
jgi:hypothetical protein